MLSRPARRAPVRRSGVGRGITARVSHTPARLESLQGGPYDRQIRRHCSVRGARPRAGRGRAVGRPRPHLGGLLLGPRVRRGGGVSAGYSAPPQPQGPEPPRAGAGGRRRSEAHRGAVDGGSGRRARLRPPHHSVPAAGRGVAGGGPRSRAAAPRGGWARGAGDPRVGANAIPEAFMSRGGCQLQQCRGGNTLQTARQRPAAHRPGQPPEETLDHQATSASALDGYLRTTGSSTSQTADTTWVWASTTSRISPFEYTRALSRSYPPECGTVRPSNRTVVSRGRSLPGLRTSLTRIAPSLQKNTSPAVPPAIAVTAILGRSARTSWPCWIFASSIRSRSFKPWDWAVTRASISSPRSNCDVAWRISCAILCTNATIPMNQRVPH